MMPTGSSKTLSDSEYEQLAPPSATGIAAVRRARKRADLSRQADIWQPAPSSKTHNCQPCSKTPVNHPSEQDILKHGATDATSTLKRNQTNNQRLSTITTCVDSMPGATSASNTRGCNPLFFAIAEAPFSISSCADLPLRAMS